MIKKLRWKFVMINMMIVTFMLCVILGLVYHFTKENVEANSINMMQNIANRPFGMESPGERKDEVRLLYFTLQIEPGGEIEAAGGGYYDLSDKEFLLELAKKVFDSRREFGIIGEYDLRYYRMVTPKFQRIVFADISNELATLKGLMEICLLIGAVSFLTFLWISILLAGWAVKPVGLAWKQQRQFVADASHELKTPLTVIMTNVEFLQNPEYDEESKAQSLAAVLAMSRQMRRLIEEMLELARADSTQSEAVRGKVDLSRLVCDAVLPFEPVFFEKGLALDTQVEEGIRVTGADAQLRQVVEILLDNAWKYSKDAGTTWISLKRQGKRQCILSVADQGDAMLPEDLKHIFKRFYRVDKARSQAGSFGLGLSIAQNIVTRHKGKIWVESEGGVNCFYVKLPCMQREESSNIFHKISGIFSA
ncbi:MAG: HAMP domain-containing histidine kinase [Ruminococcus sp.]|nr:HAMP domain-containing histidine kinase [Ruminococcus sp.]